MSNLEQLRVKIFADGADLAEVAQAYRNPLIRGFTTNPTLMHGAGIRDYRAFAQSLLEIVPDRPVSLEVWSDDFLEMERQAHEIGSWGANVYVKIPVTNTRGDFSGPLIGALAAAGIRVNVTAVMTVDQVRRLTEWLADDVASFVSVFAGRIADTGRDPAAIVAEAVRVLGARPRAEVIWASPRELLNLFQADAAGCHIITMTGELIRKLPSVGKDLETVSIETVQMFRRDALKAGFSLELGSPRDPRSFLTRTE